MRNRLIAVAISLLWFLHPSAGFADDWTHGPKTLLYIRIDFPDLPGDPISSADLKKVLTHVETYFAQNSYGDLTLRSAFPPTLRMPRRASFYESDANQQDIINDARNAAKKIGFDTAKFTFDIVAFKTHDGGNSEVAAVGGKGARILNNFRYGITLHALGHNLGLPHSDFWKTTDGNIIGAGQSLDYGDWYDPMGGGGNEFAYRNDLVIRSKAILGWLGKDGLTEVSTSGTYTLLPQDTATSGPRGLHLIRDPQNEYWIEFRQLITDNPLMMNGIRILRSYTGRNAVDLLSMNPDSPNGPGDAPLLIGHTFSDPDAKIFITPIAIHATHPPSVDVQVNLGITPPDNTLDLSLKSSTQNPTIGQPITLTAAATSSTPATLLYSWDFGDDTYDSGHDQIQHTWKQPNHDYVLRAFVTDMLGHTACKSQLITFGHPATERLIGTVTADGKPLGNTRINLQPIDSSTAASTTLSDDDGQFFLTGLHRGSYILHLLKAGYYSLPHRISIPAPNRLEISATPLDETQPTRPQSQTVTLHIHAKIDGTDELRLSPTAATWNHLAYNLPTNITLNNIPMNPQNNLPNFGRSNFLPQSIKLNSAILLNKSGRGNIDLYLDGQTLVVQFNDPDPGAADYDADIQFEK